MEILLQLGIKIISVTLIFFFAKWAIINLHKWFPSKEYNKITNNAVKRNLFAVSPVKLDLVVYFIFLLFMIVGAIALPFYAMHFQLYMLVKIFVKQNDVFVTPYGFGLAPLLVAGGLIAALFYNLLLETILKLIKRFTGKSPKDLIPALSTENVYLNINEKNLWKFLMWLTLAIIIVATPGFFSYTYFSQNTIIHRPWPGITTKEYEYSQVKNVWLVEAYKNKVSGMVKPTAPHYVIEFNDGYKWSTSSLPPEIILTNFSGDPKMVDNAIDVIAKKAKVTVKPGVDNMDL